jgi:putative solute:sodium symporter small subunit
MIEVIVGFVLLLAAGVLALGLTGTFIPIPIGLAAAYALGTIGAVLSIHGLYRVFLNRQGADRDWIRQCALAGTLLALVAVFGLLLPLLVPLLNAIKISGFPLGFYMMAQGSLIIFVMLAFLYAARAEKQDCRRQNKG